MGQPPVTSLALLAVVATSLLASSGADGLLGALLGALMLAIAVNDARAPLHHSERTDGRRIGAGAGPRRHRRSGRRLGRAGLGGRPRPAGGAAALGTETGYRFWRGRDGIGLGDIKLALVAGAWLSLATVFAAIEVATLSALAAYFITGAIRNRPMKATAFLPFGAFLAPAIWLGWLAEAMLG